MNAYRSFKRPFIWGKSIVSFIRKVVISSRAGQLQRNLPMYYKLLSLTIIFRIINNISFINGLHFANICCILPTFCMPPMYHEGISMKPFCYCSLIALMWLVLWTCLAFCQEVLFLNATVSCLHKSANGLFGAISRKPFRFASFTSNHGKSPLNTFLKGVWILKTCLKLVAFTL